MLSVRGTPDKRVRSEMEAQNVLYCCAGDAESFESHTPIVDIVGCSKAAPESDMTDVGVLLGFGEPSG